MTRRKNSRQITSGLRIVYTVKEAAQLAGVSERFIRKLIKDNVLRPVGLPGVVRLNKTEFLRKLREIKGDTTDL